MASASGKACVIGTGAMGSGMLVALHASGSFDGTQCFDVFAASAAAAAARVPGCVAAADVKAAVDGAKFILSSLPRSSNVQEAVEAALAGGTLAEGAVWVDTTSGVPQETVANGALLAKAGVRFVDAAVAGGPAKAADGTLSLMVGGSDEDVAAAGPVLDAVGSKRVHCGPLGSGHAVKAVNNALLATNVWAVGEGLVALAKQGVPLDRALAAINNSSGMSLVTQERYPKHVLDGRRFDFGFKLALMCKDLGIADAALAESGVPEDLSVLRGVSKLFAQALEESTSGRPDAVLGPDAEHMEVVKLLEKAAGAVVRGPTGAEGGEGESKDGAEAKAAEAGSASVAGGPGDADASRPLETYARDEAAVAAAAAVGVDIGTRFGDAGLGPSDRVHNFSAGPGMMPAAVLRRVQAEMLSWRGSGMGFMEISHRDPGGPVQTRMTEVVNLLRAALDIPSDFHILFFGGGANAQFGMVPMNLLGEATKADYVSTGYWADRAATEARRYCDVAAPFTAAKTLPPVSEWKIRPDAAYVHVCLNETIGGLEFASDPELPAGSPPLVADATSQLLQRPMDFSKYGCVYASAGKNLGCAGVCIVIVRDELLKRPAHPHLPTVFDYREAAHTTPVPSVVNTPPTFQVDVAGLMIESVLKAGGVRAMEALSVSRSARVYAVIDGSDGFYTNDVDPDFRSRINVPFRIRDGDRALETEFHTAAAARGMPQLFGHPVLGGLRVTMYNSVSEAAVTAAIAYMREFMAATLEREAKAKA